MRIVILFIMLFFVSKISGQENITFRKEKVYNKFLSIVLETDSLLTYFDLEEGLKNPNTQSIRLGSRKVKYIVKFDSLLSNHRNLIYINYDPLLNPWLNRLIHKIPELKGYDFALKSRIVSALPNLEKTNLKTIPSFNEVSWNSWRGLYSEKDINTVFDSITYLNFNVSFANTSTGYNFYDNYFPNLKYVDFSYTSDKLFAKYSNLVRLNSLRNFFPSKSSFNKNLIGFRFFHQHFYHIPPSKRYKMYKQLMTKDEIKKIKQSHNIMELCGAPNLEYLGFIDCTLPKKLYLCDMPLQTLIFKNTVIPKIEDSDTILTLNNLVVQSSNKGFRNLKAHKRFPNLNKLSVKNYGDLSAYIFGIDFYKKKKIGINSRKLSKLNQLTHYELYGIKDRSLGFKLPKEKSNLTTLKIEKSGLWWPPKNLEEYKNLDTLVLEVAFYRKKRLKKALLNLPNLKYVKISKSWIKGVAPNNKAFTIRHVEGDGVYTKLEWVIKENHPNDSLYLDIESKEYPLYYKNSPELESK